MYTCIHTNLYTYKLALTIIMQINIRPVGNKFIGTIQIKGSECTVNKNLQRFIILDASGSMGRNINRVLNLYLPKLFSKLGYDKEDEINLICFGSMAESQVLKVRDFPTKKQQNLGRTNMSPTVAYLKKLIKPETQVISILAISDGELHDQLTTLDDTTVFAKEIQGKYTVICRAVRLFTSTEQPDTRGLASFLQLDNYGGSTLIDINSRDNQNDICNAFISLYDSKNYNKGCKLVCSDDLIQQVPWDNPKNHLYLKEGRNTFWLTEIPQSLTLNDKEVQIQTSEQMNLADLNLVLKDKITYFLNRIKQLQVIDTFQANTEIKIIVEYFTNLEDEIETKANLIDNRLRSRFEFLTKRHKYKELSIASRMVELANNNKVGKLNSAQQAEYLRKIEINNTTKGLARRPLSTGLDFDCKVRKEIKQMHAHLSELDTVDDSNHTVSFYCQDTTLGGIKTVCKLVEENLIDAMNTLEILQLFNVVGVQCFAEVGDYTDPMTWRVKDILLGSFVSTADIISVVESGGTLKSVGDDRAITLAIPFFDNPKIQHFVTKYAPRTLEYLASFGIRRMIAEIPRTHIYIIAGGIWKMIEKINGSKLDINLDIFDKLVKAFDEGINDYFGHVMRYTKDQDTKQSYYIANNGITNMISPLIKMYQQNINLNNIDRILRALYAFEIHQAVQHMFRKNNDEKAPQQFLHKLLGIDFDKYGTKIPDLYETDEDPSFCDYPQNDFGLLNETRKQFWYLDHVTKLPVFLEASVNNNLDQIKSIPELTEDSVVKALNIDCSYQHFILGCIAQAILYPQKANRVDTENKRMIITDLGTKQAIDKMLSDYIAKIYSNEYQRLLKEKYKEEQELLNKEYVKKMVLTDNLDEFVDLIQSGMSRSYIHVQLDNVSSDAYKLLRDNLLNKTNKILVRRQKLKISDARKLLQDDLLNKTNKILLRGEKLKIFITTLYQDNKIWNNGNIPPISRKKIEEVYIHHDDINTWYQVKEYLTKHTSHLYRGGVEMKNRNGHSNDLPSYYALGFDTIDQMLTSVDNQTWEEYKKEHTTCCGFGGLSRKERNSLYGRYLMRKK